ncbi:uncharacterized protein AC631_05781 [Debaryomyces fabryi]|uniref:Oligomycin resistance ATP-dependent permease YOR1 n=1 Tax=Debaryomyces fabryi TaxID=58627 RepID=A0A0V1PQV5_9ASCO|nr:uncharacterized protein AC631_05781 [Debaryomyces fabryi]KRZ98459.1 hypothetical protein AC631_05781 [Debaryomyces fabryi]CUM57292.1 unnamed protein product [Debaryomyces fabryi]
MVENKANKLDSSSLEDNGLERQQRLLSFLWPKTVPPLPNEDERLLYGEKRAGIFSKAFFWWMIPVMNPGYMRTLQPEDLFTLTDDISVEQMSARFNKLFKKKVDKAKRKHIIQKFKNRNEKVEISDIDQYKDDLEDFTPPQFLPWFVIIETFKWEYFAAVIFLALMYGTSSCIALVTKELIKYVEYKAVGVELGIGKGLGYAFGTVGMVVFTGFMGNHYFYRAMLIGAKTKAVLIKSILDKSFILSPKSKLNFPHAKITSMMSTDTARIDLGLGLQPLLLIIPIPIIVSIAILIVNIGVSALTGIAVIILVLVLIMGVGYFLFKFRKKANISTDQRISSIREVLYNLKIIKFYSWESAYLKKISGIRNEETKWILRMQVLRNLIISIAISVNLICSMVSFLVLYAIDSDRHDPASIFSSLTLFGILSEQVIMLPLALATTTDAHVGLQRVGQFLASEESDQTYRKIEASGKTLGRMQENNIAVEVNNATFIWETFDVSDEDSKISDENSDESKNSSTTNSTSERNLDEEDKDNETPFKGLIDVNLTVNKGEFVVITGVIGSGKSSLLSAISGLMTRTSGEVNVCGSLISCGEPWIQNETFKENILFGSDFDPDFYKEVVHACSLESDMEILPAGDKTEIGERGITLSGGQKARLNLARAVYTNKDIILLDDVLSAVDARVGKHIMNNCILGTLSSKTRILATHQLSLIGSADKVIFMNGDGSLEIGKFDELIQNSSGFKDLMSLNAQEVVRDVTNNVENDSKFAGVEDEKQYIEEQLMRRTTTTSYIEDEKSGRNGVNLDRIDDGKLFLAEERAVNRIEFKVYKNYVKYGSGIFSSFCIIFLFLLFTVLATYFELFTNTWLSFWTSKKFPGRLDNFYIGLYVTFTFLAFIFLTLEFFVLAYVTTIASRTLNLMAVKKILFVPMSFMDTTPMGRIFNRFTKDTDALDNEIVEQLTVLFYFIANITGVLILCICYLPWFAIAVPPLLFLFVAIANYYQASAREIKRLEAVQRSFVYDNFNETLSGMGTIVAYKSKHRFLNKNSFLIDKMNEAYYLTIANQRWLTISLDMVGAVFVLLVAMLCVNRVFHINSSSVGLLMSYILQIVGQLSFLLKTLTQVENEMNSVERICHYAFDLPEEAPYVITENSPPPSWPEKGQISFNHASMAYRPELPLVLKDLDVNIKPMEKIGVCGRTGAGKSSIMMALYRLVELNSGSVEIDGIDISTLGLNNLRSRLSIIPQDPILFSGTIRTNLDPFDEYTDTELWDALKRSGLIDESKISSVQSQDPKSEDLNKFHLFKQVQENGTNFSLGERQLIAFARALVKRTKILILDEATSSVDYETDNKIQKTILKEFGTCTILCIAHRLKTIINYDRILVLEKGEVKEFDTPWNLFNTKDSIFEQMCRKSKITSDDFTIKTI